MATDQQLRPVDPSIWRACAGSSVQIPTVGSRVCYFPQGHAEQSSSPLFSPLVKSRPFTLCRVLAVNLLASPETDEVFAKIQLVPVLSQLDRPVAGRKDDEEKEIVSFAKVLTPSDANNGGGFSVPRYCADLIFPPLDFGADPPVQTLTVKDVHGVVFEFRHIYRGTPRRHLLTTGWNKFVNYKKLVAGDSVVFMRSSRCGENFIGIRRDVRVNACSNWRWNYFEERGEREGFSRDVRGRIPAEAVEEAARLAAKGLSFEVEYYPRPGSADFVVEEEKVKGSFGLFWTVGSRVKMAMETEDSSRMTWFQGTVSSATPDNGPWRGSPWRMLQVTWDEPDVLPNMKRVSPWQVEYVVPKSSPHSEFPPTKKCRVSPDLGLLPDADGEGEQFVPIKGLTKSMVGHLNRFMKLKCFRACIEGARQDEICVSSVSNFIHKNTHEVCSECLSGNMSPVVETVSTELNIGNSQLDNSSPGSQNGLHFFGNELIRKRDCNASPEVGITSFQLFGKIIHMK